MNASTARPHGLPLAAKAAVIPLLFLGLTALFGGWSLITAPDGSSLGMPAAWIEVTPFPDYFVPGVILFVVNGLLPFGVLWLMWRRHPLGAPTAIALGVLCMGWIVVQLLLIQRFHPVLHPGVFGLGLVIAVLGWLWWRADGFPYRDEILSRLGVRSGASSGS